MRASDYIKKIQRVIDIHGDIDIVMRNNDGYHIDINTKLQFQNQIDTSISGLKVNFGEKFIEIS